MGLLDNKEKIMIRKRELGFVSVGVKESELAYSARRQEYSRIREEWLAGKAFIDFMTVHGYAVTIKAACIETMILCTPEAIKSQLEDNAQEVREDKEREKEY